MDLQTMTPDQLTDLSDEVKAELIRRQNGALIDREIGQVLERARANGLTSPREDGQPWVQPTGAHDSYLVGDTVEHADSVWQSTVNGNVWEPGISGWRRQRKDGKPPAFVQPTGGHDAYRLGEQVTDSGQVFESVIDYNVWSPTTYPAGWKSITAEEDTDPDGEQPDTPGAISWQPGVALTVGQTVTHDGATYTVRQAHTAQAGWEPANVAALFEVMPDA